MKFSARTVAIIKNFSKFSPNIVFRPGNVLFAISPEKNLIGKAELEETIPCNFIIFDSSKFLGISSLMKDPNYEFDDLLLTVKEGNKKITIPCADSSVVTMPPEEDLDLQEKVLDFSITEEDFKALLKATSIMQAPEIVLYSQKGTVFISAKNENVSKEAGFTIDIGISDEIFKIKINSELLQLIPDNYQIEIFNVNDVFISTFTGELKYTIPCEINSKIG